MAASVLPSSYEELEVALVGVFLPLLPKTLGVVLLELLPVVGVGENI